MKKFWSVLILATLWPYISGTKLETLKKCCTLGTNYANSGLKCSSFQPPIAGIPQQDEKMCLNSVDVCCKQVSRERQCKLGQENALAGSTCTSSDDDPGEFTKDCCEACQLGIETATTNQPCDSELGLGTLINSAFTTCCKSRTPVTTSTTPTTTTVTTTTSQLPSNITKSLEKYDESNPPPPPSLEELCDIPDLCAHKCTTTGNSYKCECYPGFSLMDDGISCKPSKRATISQSWSYPICLCWPLS